MRSLSVVVPVNERLLGAVAVCSVVIVLSVSFIVLLPDDSTAEVKDYTALGGSGYTDESGYFYVTFYEFQTPYPVNYPEESFRQAMADFIGRLESSISVSTVNQPDYVDVDVTNWGYQIKACVGIRVAVGDLPEGVRLTWTYSNGVITFQEDEPLYFNSYPTADDVTSPEVIYNDDGTWYFNDRTQNGGTNR